jgi:glutamate-1-semialdehyde 2,1-aminomutase
MEKMAPLGDVYQAGTFNGNPLSAAAGLAAIKELEKPGVYETLESRGDRMRRGLESISEDLRLDARVYGAASMFQIYFTGSEVIDYSSALKADKEVFRIFQSELQKRGVFLPPSQYECNFISTTHSTEKIDETLEKMEESLKKVL